LNCIYFVRSYDNIIVLDKWTNYSNNRHSQTGFLLKLISTTWTANVVCWTYWNRKISNHQWIPARSTKRNV